MFFSKQHESFYLVCRSNRVITDACRHPPKHLRYLGWCVLGSLQDGQGHQVCLGHLSLRVTCSSTGLPFMFLCNSEANDTSDVLFHAVLEVIRLRSQVPSQTTETLVDIPPHEMRNDACGPFAAWCLCTSFLKAKARRHVSITIFPYN